MARIRDLLWRADGPGAERPVPASCAEAPSEEVQAESSEVPFIEVGGPHKLVEASPSVMAATPGPLARKPLPLPQTSVESAPKATAPVAERLIKRPPAINAESPGTTSGRVAFRPLGQEPAPLPPAAKRFAPGLVAFHKPDDPVSEQYRVLARELETQLTAGKPHLLLFAAANRSTQTTTMVLNLAITRAKKENTTGVVLDANLLQPGVAEQLGLPATPGLGEVLAGSISLHRAVRESGLERLHVLTAGKTADGGNCLIASQAMQAVLRHLRGRYSWVLVAAPFWEGRPELVTLSCACDAVYLVLSETESDSSLVRDLMHMIPRQGVSLRGCILAS